MNTEPKNPQQRSDARRAQILNAATDCFRTYGFHGASIARISEASGMSPGHIYHYFENKEAIIEAIVTQDLERLLILNDELRAAYDIKGTFIERAAEGVHDHLDLQSAGLQLEIMAEAARNPRVATFVRAADRSCVASFHATLRSLRRAAGHEDSETNIIGMGEVIAAMFEGLLIRVIRNPDIDKTLVTRMFRKVIHEMLSQPVQVDVDVKSESDMAGSMEREV
ncbi:MAG: TetR/AcrR family transcriptional regulator [Pseudomonadota bacterium]